MFVQVLTDAADSQHGALAMLCLAALARGAAGHHNSLHAAGRAVNIPQAKLTQMFKQLAPNLQVINACLLICSWLAQKTLAASHPQLWP